MKNILVIYYSQTGQLKEISDSLLSPFKAEEAQIDYYRIQMKEEFPFPWKGEEFYNVFPESFQQIPSEILTPPTDILEKEYDLVILAYQIWFLTPSIPINSFLKSEYAQQLLGGRKVITVIGCRNMWAKAQQKTKTLLLNAGGTLVGNIAFVDKSPNLISVITIVHWVMGGKKTKKWGIFPKPGVSQEDIQGASIFGELIQKSLQNNDFSTLQKELIQAKGVELKPFIVFMDEKANKMFSIWSNFILKNQENRKFKLQLFKYYLLTALFVISPIVLTIFTLIYPLRIGQIRRKKDFYLGV